MSRAIIVLGGRNIAECITVLQEAGVNIYGSAESAPYAPDATRPFVALRIESPLIPPGADENATVAAFVNREPGGKLILEGFELCSTKSSA